MVTYRHLKLLMLVLLLTGLSIGLIHCGIKGPPKAPRRNNPPAVTDLSHQIEGQQVILTWSIPPKDKQYQDDLAGFKIYRSMVPLSETDCAECPLQFKRIGNIPVLNQEAPVPMKFSDELENGYRYVYFVRGYDQNQLTSEDSNQIEFEF